MAYDPGESEKIVMNVRMAAAKPRTDSHGRGNRRESRGVSFLE